LLETVLELGNTNKKNVGDAVKIQSIHQDFSIELDRGFGETCDSCLDHRTRPRWRGSKGSRDKWDESLMSIYSGCYRKSWEGE
jgi:hypothetical protein